MRRFSSYGPVNIKTHYYVPREALIERAYTRLIGEVPEEGGHYITVWAPRQTGKSWLMLQLFRRFENNPDYDFVHIPLEHLKEETDTRIVLSTIAEELGEELGKTFTGADNKRKFQYIFKRGSLDKPLILVLDEFDSLSRAGINAVVSAFRNIYNRKDYMLHGVALIGVRSALGVESDKGSPFNVQQSLHVPNLTFDEVREMFRWYERESGQGVESGVIEGLFRETRGQPGLTSWFGELLTQGLDDYQPVRDRSITVEDFDQIYAAATYDFPNTNIMNIISKARQEPYKELVLDLFRTDEKMEFTFDDPRTNFLYMHGVIDREMVDAARRCIRFSCPFVQKRLFNYFSRELYRSAGQLHEPLMDLTPIVSGDKLDVKNLVHLYGEYLKKNSHWLFKEAPRRTDMKIREAVFHFNLYAYLNSFLKSVGGNVFPEFPTGNGQVDLLIGYKGKRYALEVKSFSNMHLYREALKQAAKYVKSMGLSEVFLLFFIESIDDKNRSLYEKRHHDKTRGVEVVPIFVETGNP
ncbi:MAG: AAA family ATPase [bacterium]|nr:AAA family ATPase [bacterium]